MQYLREIILPLGQELLKYFDVTYVTGIYKRNHNEHNGRIPLKIKPVYPPETWNVWEVTLTGEDRTNNQTEGWKNRFKNLARHYQLSVYLLIEKMQQEVTLDKMKLQQISAGISLRRKKRTLYESAQKRLHNLCYLHKSGLKTVKEFLQAIAYSIKCIPMV